MQSQGQGGGGTPGNYLAGLLQGYQQSSGQGGYRPQYQQGYQPGYQSGFVQRPPRPVSPENLQDLQYQQQYQQGQGSLGYDPANGGQFSIGSFVFLFLNFYHVPDFFRGSDGDLYWICDSASFFLCSGRGIYIFKNLLIR